MATESEVEATCQEGLAQKAKQAAVEQAKKAKEAIDKASQDLAKIPVDVAKQLEDAKDLLLKFLCGYENPSNEDFEPEKLVTELENLLNPVISGLSSLPVPEIPGLSKISGLLQTLVSMIPNSSGKTDAEIKDAVPNKPSIPQKFLDIIGDIIDGIQSIIVALPMVLINVIFQMFKCVIDMFDMICGVIGVPAIPYPLSLVPTCINIVPDIFELITNTATKVQSIAKGVVMKKVREIQALQFPSLPDSIETPETSPCCSEHSS